MRLSKERKAYIAVFGLGLIALAADRLWFTPASAAAAPGEPEPAAPEHATAPSAPEVPAGPSFGERLAERVSWQEGPLLDPFIVDSDWGVGGEAGPSGEPAPAASVFAQAHRLSAVFKSSSGRSTIILDGRLLKIGDAVEGYTLADVDDSKEAGRAAVFEKAGVRIRVPVQDRAESRKTDKSPR